VRLPTSSFAVAPVTPLHPCAAAAPVVSISVGDACDFGYCDSRPEEADAALVALGGGDKVKTLRLDSGDVLVFGGPSRMVYHGCVLRVECVPTAARPARSRAGPPRIRLSRSVTKVYPNRRPKALVLAPGRLNLTFR
jgi:hypothetical protein